LCRNKNSFEKVDNNARENFAYLCCKKLHNKESARRASQGSKSTQKRLLVIYAFTITTDITDPDSLSLWFEAAFRGWWFLPEITVNTGH
jgi:hypothetical protein